MALLSKSLALVSVGISCQTAHQIEEMPMGLFAGRDELVKRSTPFDWLLCPVKSAAKMIGERTFFPSDVAELDLAHKPFWSRMGCHFWHQKDPRGISGWGPRVVENWERIADSERKVFIVSNTQNNVTRALLEADRDPIECRLIWHDVFRLFAALCRQFGEIELHCVTHDAKPMATTAIVMPWESGRTPITVHTIARDRSSWEGNAYAWHKLLKGICG